MSLSLVSWLWCKLRGCDFFCTRELWRGKFWQWCPRVSVLMAGLSYGAGTVLSYSSPTMQNFLLFRDIHIIPLRRSPRYGGLAELITISMLCGMHGAGLGGVGWSMQQQFIWWQDEECITSPMTEVDPILIYLPPDQFPHLVNGFEKREECFKSPRTICVLYFDRCTHIIFY